ncbi:hypothetical protein F9278_15755 [Streptomyces phaeolivaceus]|uniref:Recombinase RecT n=1 Tax=Streptomyces phaeolivaceus TaxID=2653200 RepID=A0A5P8K2D2_9ACTN|nr:hypothetical protein [Streptomyces phaeolivaceus]QFQ97423.1 hypothetical protein F9278_15755 [Streptomyces phaeolivaceus]
MSAELVKHQNTTPATLDGAVRFAQLLADADLLPRQFIGKPANVLYAVEYGRTLGITPVAAITGIHVIEGKPSASSGLIGGLVRKAGHKLRVKSDGMSWATAQIVRADDPEFTYECTWNLQRAEQAGLLQIKDGKPFARDRNGKPATWEKYTAAMLKARAITEVARDACEDVLFGLHYTPEELGANVNADGEVVEADVQQLRRVQPGEADQWTTPEQGGEFEPHAAAQALAVRASEVKTRTEVTAIVNEARDSVPSDARIKAPDTGEQDGLREYLTRCWKALPAEDKPGAGGESGEIVETGPSIHGSQADADAATAEKQLRAAAQAAGLTNLDEEFEKSYGLPIDMAGAQQLREMTAILTGSAA